MPTLLLIGGLGIVAVALLVVPGMFAQAPDEENGSPSPTSSIPVAVSFPPSEFASVDWQISPLGADSDGAVITKLVLAGDRLVAIGARGGTAVAWWSDDLGQTWTQGQVEPPGPPPSEAAEAVPRTAAASGQRAVASGFWLDPGTGEILGAVVWTSDDGHAWETHDLGSSMPGATLDRIIGTPDGFYATGHASDIQPFGWWYSSDGVAWHEVMPDGLPDLAMLPPATAWGADRFLVAGGHGGSRTRPGIWAAATLLGFEEVFDDQETFGWITSLAHADYGWIAAGQTQEGSDDAAGSHLAAWISADGRAWQRLEIESAATTASSIVAANAPGAVILGWSMTAQAPQAWFLPGGAGQPSVAQFPIVVHDLIALEDRFVAVGGCPLEQGCSGPMIFTGTPTEDSGVPGPTLPPR